MLGAGRVGFCAGRAMKFAFRTCFVTLQTSIVVLLGFVWDALPVQYILYRVFLILGKKKIMSIFIVSNVNGRNFSAVTWLNF